MAPSLRTPAERRAYRAPEVAPYQRRGFDQARVPEDTGRYKSVAVDDIAAFFLDRLRALFPHVAPNPRLLHNSRGNPLYMLCFACANPSENAGRRALKVAEHLLSDRFAG